MAENVQLVVTSVGDIPQILDRVRAGFKKRKSWPEDQQREHSLSQLKAFLRLIQENKERILSALQADLNKGAIESVSSEINLVLADILEAIRDYDDWTKPHYVSKSFAYKTDDCYVKAEPFGVALIFGAWNYPFQLVSLPFVGAVAAGNSVIIKPSEISVNTSNLFAELIPRYMDKDHYAVISGGVDIGQALLRERFDHIFYTGSTKVGKIVMRAAAEHLTPVVLELGGKTPVIIAEDANVDVAARRILWAKNANSGQTCIAPDYVLCSQKVRDQFIESCRRTMKDFYGGKDPYQTPDYCRMVSQSHFQRVKKIMDSTKATKVIGGDTLEEERYIPPTVYIDVKESDPLMAEEIFGPLLPVLTVNNVDEAIEFVNERERPLAFYVFTESKSTFDRVSSSTCSGSIVQNNTATYAGLNTLPFGGIGHSGMGAYHGKNTFYAYSHMKPTLRSNTKLEMLTRLIYPPHNKGKIWKFNLLQLPSTRKWNKSFLLVLLVITLAVVVKIFGVPRFVYNRFV